MSEYPSCGQLGIPVSRQLWLLFKLNCWKNRRIFSYFLQYFIVHCHGCQQDWNDLEYAFRHLPLLLHHQPLPLLPLSLQPSLLQHHHIHCKIWPTLESFKFLPPRLQYRADLVLTLVVGPCRSCGHTCKLSLSQTSKMQCQHDKSMKNYWGWAYFTDLPEKNISAIVSRLADDWVAGGGEDMQLGHLGQHLQHVRLLQRVVGDVQDWKLLAAFQLPDILAGLQLVPDGKGKRDKNITIYSDESSGIIIFAFANSQDLRHCYTFLFTTLKHWKCEG